MSGRNLIGTLVLVVAGLLAVGTLSALAGAGPADQGGDQVGALLGLDGEGEAVCDGDSGDDGEAEAVEFVGRVIAVGTVGLALRTDSDVVLIAYTPDTAFEDANGEPISQSDVLVGLDVSVLAVPVDNPNLEYFEALQVRLLDEGENDAGGDVGGDETDGDADCVDDGDGDTDVDTDTDGDGDTDGDTDGDETGDTDDGQGNDGEGPQKVAQAIADTFGVPVDDVLALHDSGVGFGAIFKLYVLAAAGDTTVEALLSDGEGDDGFAFGQQFKAMEDEVSALSAEGDGMPKNLGQAVSDAEKGDEGEADATDADGGEDAGKGPPEHAPAHGRR